MNKNFEKKYGNGGWRVRYDKGDGGNDGGSRSSYGSRNYFIDTDLYKFKQHCVYKIINKLSILKYPHTINRITFQPSTSLYYT